jgi:drug/metabolite transporter (DMT)-like permease
VNNKIFTNSVSLYLSSVLIWGSTWFAIKFQLGVVAAEVSLVYRFGIAALLLLLFCMLSGRSLRYSAHIVLTRARRRGG